MPNSRLSPVDEVWNAMMTGNSPIDREILSLWIRHIGEPVATSNKAFRELAERRQDAF